MVQQYLPIKSNKNTIESLHSYKLSPVHPYAIESAETHFENMKYVSGVQLEREHENSDVQSILDEIGFDNP